MVDAAVSDHERLLSRSGCRDEKRKTQKRSLRQPVLSPTNNQTFEETILESDLQHQRRRKRRDYSRQNANNSHIPRINPQRHNHPYEVPNHAVPPFHLFFPHQWPADSNVEPVKGRGVEPEYVGRGYDDQGCC
jgi:hypothetical protein